MNLIKKTLKTIISIQWVIICVHTPIAVSMTPTFAVMASGNISFLWLYFLSLPIGVMVADKMWSTDLMGKF